MARRPIAEVLEIHTPGLMKTPGVTGVGDGTLDGEPCVILFVREKTPELITHLPTTVGGYPVRVEQAGEARPQGRG